MATPTDPLSYLRTALSAGKTVKLDGDAVVIDGLRVPARTLTNYRSRQDGKFYPLDAVWFLWQNKDLPAATYVRDAYAATNQFVALVDRTDLVNYVAGETDTSPQLDLSFLGDDAWMALMGAFAHGLLKKEGAGQLASGSHACSQRRGSGDVERRRRAHPQGSSLPPRRHLRHLQHPQHPHHPRLARVVWP